MLQHRENPDLESPGYSDVVNATGNMDYVKDGKLYKNMPTPSVMVAAQTELASMLADYPPGTIAYTAGYEEMWQKAVSGNWATII